LFGFDLIAPKKRPPEGGPSGKGVYCIASLDQPAPGVTSAAGCFRQSWRKQCREHKRGDADQADDQKQPHWRHVETRRDKREGHPGEPERLDRRMDQAIASGQPAPRGASSVWPIRPGRPRHTARLIIERGVQCFAQPHDPGRLTLWELQTDGVDGGTLTERKTSSFWPPPPRTYASSPS
jgi:hypothetical protein